MDFFAVSFVVDIERPRDAKLLFAYLNEADAYQMVAYCIHILM